MAVYAINFCSPARITSVNVPNHGANHAFIRGEYHHLAKGTYKPWFGKFKCTQTTNEEITVTLKLPTTYPRGMVGGLG
ncbi:MAG: hypothetical protein ACTHJT_15825 [Cytophaga sp.]|uniref:hypothetical protein n=1 Tax=Cytophaga sp. TaxID=29535 RepID=UPI003F7DF7FE